MKNIIWFIFSIFLQLYFCKNGEYVLYFSHYPQVQPKEELSLLLLMRQQIITNICIGTPKQCLDVRVGFNAYYSLVCSGKENGTQFIPEQSETFQNFKETLVFNAEGSIASGTAVRDFLTTQSNKQIPFKFYYSKNDEQCKNASEIGLNLEDRLRINDKKNSLIEQLEEKKIIDNTMILINHTSNETGTITISPSKDKLNGFSYNFKIRGGNIRTPDSLINEISLTYGNNGKLWRNSFKKRMTLNYNSKIILAPNYFVKELANALFQDYAKTGACSIQSNKEKMVWVMCSRKIQEIIKGSLQMKFDDGNAIAIEIKDLFVHYFEFILFAIVGKEVIVDFSVGDIFLQNYLVLFDQKNNMLRLFPKKGINRLPFNYKFIYILVLSICTFGIIFILLSNNFLSKIYNHK